MGISAIEFGVKQIQLAGCGKAGKFAAQVGSWLNVEPFEPRVQTDAGKHGQIASRSEVDNVKGAARREMIDCALNDPDPIGNH